MWKAVKEIIQKKKKVLELKQIQLSKSVVYRYSFQNIIVIISHMTYIYLLGKQTILRNEYSRKGRSCIDK